MEWEIYELERIGGGLGYWFYSGGPRGCIRKIIEFQWMRELGTSTFNLAFGDSMEGSDRLNDRSVSDNCDRLKVLHTVAAAAMYFLRDHPNSIIIKPSSIARARLYQMMMSSIWKNIERQYEIMGKYGSDWIPFRRGLNYSDFIAYKKFM